MVGTARVVDVGFTLVMERSTGLMGATCDRCYVDWCWCYVEGVHLVYHIGFIHQLVPLFSTNQFLFGAQLESVVTLVILTCSSTRTLNWCGIPCEGVSRRGTTTSV